MTTASIDFDVPVRMRDGVTLRADVYRPSEMPAPVLVTRTPYDKFEPSGLADLDPLALVRRGFIVVIQDTRARFMSGGAQWEPFVYEAQDGHDTAEWAAKIEGSSGAVGMFGMSYLGNAQWMAAATAPSGLRAIAPAFTWSNPYDGLFSRGGAIELGISVWWSLMMASDVLMRRYHDNPEVLGKSMRALVSDSDQLATSVYAELPAGRHPALQRAGTPSLGFEQALHNENFAAGCTVHPADVAVPQLIVAGWYDIFLQGSLDNFAGRRPDVPARLLVGPWVHFDRNHQVGQTNFGLAANGAAVDLETTLTQIQADWFDHWLREPAASDVPSDLPSDVPGAPVRLFVMGINRWRDEQQWPPERAVDTPFYLQADASLSSTLADASEALSFSYDPADPVPTVGGATLMSTEYVPGVADQRDVESRADVLTFSTEPLSENCEVTGRIRARIFAETDCPSTDWVVRLCDVDEDGVSRNVTDGILRVSGTQGQICSHEIDLWSTSMVFLAGHRIRIQVTSSNFPRWDRNLNTGEPIDVGTDIRTASQRIFFGGPHPTTIWLPIVKESDAF